MQGQKYATQTELCLLKSRRFRDPVTQKQFREALFTLQHAHSLFFFFTKKSVEFKQTFFLLNAQMMLSIPK